jgi:hypothetical protein
MTASVREQQVGGLPWLVISGERLEVFQRLGEVARTSIREVQEAMPEREGLQRWIASGRGAENYKRVVAATKAGNATQLAELDAMARGAAIEFEAVLLANLRGDVGTHDGTGCSDLAWHGEKSIVSHNEDAAPALNGQLAFVTLAIDGEPTVTAQWYPGFLPSNAFTATAAGLAWGINHIQVASPGVGAGRHFVMRALQSAPSIEAAISDLRKYSMAGGFAVTMGSTTNGCIVSVESAAGCIDTVEVSKERALCWHTNHLRRLPRSIDAPSSVAFDDPTQQLGGYEESSARGAVLDKLQAPHAEPDDYWFLQQLAGAPLPCGVRRTATGGDPLMTLCTTVTNLTEDRILVRGAAGQVATLTLSEFVRGNIAEVEYKAQSSTLAAT